MVEHSHHTRGVISSNLSAAIDNEAQTATLLSQPGLVLETMPYMSPEQVNGEPLCVSALSKKSFRFLSALHEAGGHGNQLSQIYRLGYMHLIA